jgi:hypothetical protein
MQDLEVAQVVVVIADDGEAACIELKRAIVTHRWRRVWRCHTVPAGSAVRIVAMKHPQAGTAAIAHHRKAAVI